MLLKANQIAGNVGLAGNLQISGKIERVFGRKEGNTEKYGDWSFQGFVISDETGEMAVSLKNRKDSLKKDDVGKTITISSKETANGMLGVKIEEDEWENDKGEKKTAVKVIVTQSADIKFADGTTTTKAEAQEPSPAPAKEATRTEPVPQLDYEQIRKDTIKVTYEYWREIVGVDKIAITDPAYTDLLKTIIEVAGKNADTLFIARTGRR